MKAKLKIIIPTIIAIAAVIIAAVCIKFVPEAGENIESMLTTAQKYLVEQNYEQAIAEFNKIIALDPMNADAYLGLAQAYIDMGDTESAIETLEKGFELTGDERLALLLNVLINNFSETQIADVDNELVTTGLDISEINETGTTEDDNSNNNNVDILSTLETAEIGDYVSFGQYNKDNINWLVLNKENNTLLLISSQIIVKKPYNDEWGEITWENCTLRQWLNNDFYNEAFSIDDQKKIQLTNNINSDNKIYGTNGGNDTSDKVFILSSEEAEKFIINDSFKRPDSSSSHNEWWLRTPSTGQNHACIIDTVEKLYPLNGAYTHGENGVRPVIRVKTD